MVWQWPPAVPSHDELYALALHAAPILWFSDAEPLLWQRATPRAATTGAARQAQQPAMSLQEESVMKAADAPKAPAPLPCDDAPSPRPVVYFRLDRVLLHRDLTKAEQAAFDAGQHAPWEAARQVRLNYYFYYPYDEGLNPHRHDVESISVDLAVVPAARQAPSQRRRRAGPEGSLPPRLYFEVDRVTGWAHGSEFLANILQVRPSRRSSRGAPDVRLPLTVLVEEGKHASSPDRSGDGQYTPGVDVNIRVPDAWGVRDVFGSGVIGSRYAAHMTKSRLKPLMTSAGNGSSATERYRIGPALEPGDPLRQQYDHAAGLNGGLGFPRVEYELRRATSFKQCAVAAPFSLKRPTERVDWAREGELFKADCSTGDQADGLGCGYLNLPKVADRRFGGARLVRHDRPRPLDTAFAAVRYDGGGYGFAGGFYLSYGLPKVAGWFNLGATPVRRAGRWSWSANAYFTPSVATLAAWYVGLGYDWERGGGATSGDDLGFRRGGRFAMEGGVQVRHQAWSVRLGVRTAVSQGGLGGTRLVSEVGWGPSPHGSRVR